MIRKLALCVVLAVGLWGCGSDTANPPETQCSGPDLVFYQGGRVVGVSANDSRCIGGNHG